MTEDEFQTLVRYPGYPRDTIVLHLVTGLVRLDLAEIMLCLGWLARLNGWRLADLSVGGPAGGEAELRVAIAEIVGTLDRSRTPPYQTTEGRTARDHAQMQIAWRALMGSLAARGLDYHAQLGVVAAATSKGVAPLPLRWSPPPVLPPHEDPPFTLRFGARELTMQGMTVTLDGASQTFDERSVAMLVFEVNALAFEAEGLVGVAAVPADVPGTLGPILALDDGSSLVFQRDELREAVIYDGDSAGFYDCTVLRANECTEGLGAFAPNDAYPAGALAIHMLRRLFSHPAAAGAYRLHLQLSYGIDRTLDWLAARPEAARLDALTLWISRDYDGPKYVKPRPLGAEFPKLSRLETSYVVWLSHFAGAPFPALEHLTLTEMHDWSRQPRRVVPSLADVAASIAANVPMLYQLSLGPKK